MIVTKSFFSSVVFVLCCIVSFSQGSSVSAAEPYPLWNKTFDTSIPTLCDMNCVDYRIRRITDIAVDKDGNSYVMHAGFDINYDYLLVKYDPLGNELWSKKYNEKFADIPSAIAVDKDGYVYVAGTSSYQSGGGDILLVKFDSNGNMVWTRHVYGPVVYDIAVDDGGNVYILYYYYPSYRIIKYDSSGLILWQKALIQPLPVGEISNPFMTVDSNRNVYVTGYIENTYNSSLDIVLIKLDSSGTPSWSKAFDNGGDETAQDVAADTHGNVYVTGWSIGANPSLLLMKFDPSGNVLWSQSYSEGAGTRGVGLSVDKNDNVYIAGSILPTSYPAYDYLIVKYDSSGNRIWATTFDQGGMERAERIGVDPMGNIVLTGTTDVNMSRVLTVKFNVTGLEPCDPATSTCDDNNTCTIDSCSMGVCVHTNMQDGTSCSDGLFCTLTDACQNGVCTGSGSACAAGTICNETTDLCDIVDCTGKAAGTVCNDSNVCTTNDVCKKSGKKMICAGTAAPTGTSCNDDNLCTTNDVCTNGACKGTAKVCTDNDLCTTDTCDAATGACVSTPLICNDNNSCTTDTCNTATGCAFTPVADGNKCTEIRNGVCRSGVCSRK